MAAAPSQRQQKHAAWAKDTATAVQPIRQPRVTASAAMDGGALAWVGEEVWAGDVEAWVGEEVWAVWAGEVDIAAEISIEVGGTKKKKKNKNKK